MAVLPLPAPSDDWRDHAACAGHPTETFYDTTADAVEESKLICGRCPVQDACLSEALTFGDDHGIWAGLTGKERKTLDRGSVA